MDDERFCAHCGEDLLRRHSGLYCDELCEAEAVEDLERDKTILFERLKTLETENSKLKTQLSTMQDNLLKAFHTYAAEVNGAALPYKDNTEIFIQKALDAVKETNLNQWGQPIGTAPTDRPFLAYQHIVEDPQDMDNYWIAEWFEGELECGAPNPTHWAELLAPPAEAFVDKKGALSQ